MCWRVCWAWLDFRASATGGVGRGCSHALSGRSALSQRTLEFHWGKHHAAYINNLNNQIKGTDLENLSLDDVRRGRGVLATGPARLRSRAWRVEGEGPTRMCSPSPGRETPAPGMVGDWPAPSVPACCQACHAAQPLAPLADCAQVLEQRLPHSRVQQRRSGREPPVLLGVHLPQRRR